MKVEVHHIVPRSKGGEDSEENAIALCFDCHCDAGHYNPDHPRGTKFSPEELRQARDLWYLMVSGNQIPESEPADLLYCRYILCTSDDALQEILAHDLSNFPADNPLLVNNRVLEYVKSIPPNRPESPDPYQRTFESRDEYQKVHPGVRIFSPIERGINYPYFEASRIPSIEELRESIAPKSGIATVLIQDEVQPADIAEALMFHNVCGDDSYEESVRVRPLWLILLVATNITDELLRLEAVQGEIELSMDTNYRRLNTKLAEAFFGNMNLPRMQIPPGTSVVIPIATAVGPLHETHIDSERREINELPIGAFQSLDHGKLEERKREISLIGPAVNPTAVVLEKGSVQGFRYRQAVHQLDLDNMYILSRGFEAGCCPHLFYEYEGSRLAWVSELWADSPRIDHSNQVTVPEGVSAIVVAELEREITKVTRIVVNGDTVVGSLELRSGDQVRFSVEHGDQVTLVGSYYPIVPINISDPWTKNTCVRDYLRSESTRA